VVANADEQARLVANGREQRRTFARPRHKGAPQRSATVLSRYRAFML
jgi:hypothetical protein